MFGPARQFLLSTNVSIYYFGKYIDKSFEKNQYFLINHTQTLTKFNSPKSQNKTQAFVKQGFTIVFGRGGF